MEPPNIPSTTLSHDAFISYSHHDRSWVDASLVGPLERAGLRVLIDHRDFDLGVPSVLNMERAVDRSRHTLVVLTPDWVDSEWSNFESLLVTTSDPIGRRRRLIPLLLRRCELPLRLSMLSYADFTEPAHYATQIAHVIRSVTPQPEPVTGGGAARAVPVELEPIRGEPVRKGVEALSRLMQEPAVRAAAISFNTLFRDAGTRIDVLGSYKDVHDLLHSMQVHYHDQVVQEARGFPDDEMSCENLANHAITLQSLVSELREIAGRELLPRGDIAWIETELARAVLDLQLALDTKNPRPLAASAWTVGRLLATRPSLINTRLNEAARSLNLPALGDALALMVEEARRSSFDREKVRTFEVGVTALRDLATNLSGLVEQHDRWQQVDVDLRPLIRAAKPDDEFEYAWPAIRDQLETLTAGASDDWVNALAREIHACDGALARAEPPGLGSAVRRLNRLVTDRFYRIDLLLKRQCDELRKVCDPLAAVLRILE